MSAKILGIDDVVNVTDLNKDQLHRAAKRFDTATAAWVTINNAFKQLASDIEDNVVDNLDGSDMGKVNFAERHTEIVTEFAAQLELIGEMKEPFSHVNTPIIRSTLNGVLDTYNPVNLRFSNGAWSKNETLGKWGGFALSSSAVGTVFRPILMPTEKEEDRYSFSDPLYTGISKHLGDQDIVEVDVSTINSFVDVVNQKITKCLSISRKEVSKASALKRKVTSLAKLVGVSLE